MLREVADLTGLIGNVTEVLADTYQGPWVHEPGGVFADLAVAVADGADCVSGIGTLVDQQRLHGMVASLTTTWRLLDQRLTWRTWPGSRRPGLPRGRRPGRPARRRRPMKRS